VVRTRPTGPHHQRVQPLLVYRCLDCGVRRDVAPEGSAAALADLLLFLRQHPSCDGMVVIDRLVVLPAPRDSDEELASGYVDGDLHLHAVAGASPVVLCSGEVLLSRGSGPFSADAPDACARCVELLQRVHA
jgi:hypothetical protein